MNDTERTTTWCSNGQISSVIDPFMAKKMSIWAPRHHLRSAWSGWLRWPSPYVIRCDYRDISNGSGCFIIVELSTKNIVLPQFSAICSCFWNLWWAISLRVRGLRGFWKHFYMSYFSWRIHWYPWFCRAIPRSCSDRYFGLKKSEFCRNPSFVTR